MPRIPPQSEPVDAKELYKRLEKVLEEREAKERRRRSRSAQRTSSAQQNDRSNSPPPPTALPTRPISEIPDYSLSRPRSSAAKSNSTITHDALPPLYDSYKFNPEERFGPPLTIFGQNQEKISNQSFKGPQRPSTSWHSERFNHPLVQEAEEIGVAISMRLERPKSMSYLTSEDSSPVVVKTEIPLIPIPKRNPNREGKENAPTKQSVAHDMVKESLNSAPQTIETSQESSPVLNHGSSFNGTSTVRSAHSSATTALDHSASHSTSSQSKPERRSWHPKAIISRLKDFNNSSEKLVMENKSATQSTSALEQFTFGIPPISETQLVSLARRSNGESPILGPSRQKSYETFQPFAMTDNRLSQVSDTSTNAFGDSQTRPQLSDLDSGLGMSESSSSFGMRNLSTESIPTLRPGAEKRADWTKMDASRLKDARIGSAILLESGEIVGPAKVARESALRNEIEYEEAVFDAQSGLQLQLEPPEDEGVFIHTSPPKLSHRISSQKAEIFEAPVSQVGSDTSDATAQPRKRSGSRSFFSRRSFSQKSTKSQNSHSQSSSAHVIELDSFTPAPAPTAYSSRPASRSQPILLAGYDANEPVPKLPTFTTAQLPAKNRESAESHITASLLATPNLTAQKLPQIRQNEMQYMNAQCRELLRAQEQLLMRRSTMQHNSLNQHSASMTSSSVHNPTLATEAAIEEGKLGVTQPKITKRRSSNPFSRNAGRSIPTGSTSMIDLNVVEPMDNGSKSKRKGWWKAWKT